MLATGFALLQMQRSGLPIRGQAFECTPRWALLAMGTLRLLPRLCMHEVDSQGGDDNESQYVLNVWQNLSLVREFIMNCGVHFTQRAAPMVLSSTTCLVSVPCAGCVRMQPA